MVVHERFAILIPSSYPLKFAGPVMCAGITMYDPLMKQGAKQGTRVGIVGLGGLGVMGIKLAKALGCKVTAISRSKGKEQLALECGALNFVASADLAAMSAAEKSLDLILSTIPAAHDWSMYQPLLVQGGVQVLLGAHSGTGAATYAAKLQSAPSVISSVIGGVTNTQEVIDICARAGIYPEIEVVPVQKLSEVYTALDASNDSGKRYVLDLGASLNEQAFATCNAPPPTLGPNTTRLTMGAVGYELLRMTVTYPAYSFARRGWKLLLGIFAALLYFVTAQCRRKGSYQM